jgi:hypothetical protein
MVRAVSQAKACTTRQNWIETEMESPILQMMHVAIFLMSTMVKNLGTVTANANGTYTVTYQVIVKNVGGASR